MDMIGEFSSNGSKVSSLSAVLPNLESLTLVDWKSGADSL